MSTEIKTPKIGDIFELALQNDQKSYVQYIGNDKTQLNSDVIRVFKSRYSREEKVSLKAIVQDQVELYLHVTGVEFGVDDHTWTWFGHVEDLGSLHGIFFKGSYDYGNPEIKKSERWYAWELNGPMVPFNEMKIESTTVNMGVVMRPKDVRAFMETGKLPFFYPSQ